MHACIGSVGMGSPPYLFKLGAGFSNFIRELLFAKGLDIGDDSSLVEHCAACKLDDVCQRLFSDSWFG